jgi:hypothetical protein
MTSLQRYTCKATLVGLCLAAASGAYAQVSSINSAMIVSNLFSPRIPGSVFSSVNAYNAVISLNEANVSSPGAAPNTFANRDVWYFSNNGGATAYSFQNNDYFNASFNLTLGGGVTGFDLEAGWLFSNPSGSIGGDLQTVITKGGAVFQAGGPSYYPFSPAAGGYPGAGGSVPNYTNGQTYAMGLNYVVDPNTGMNAFQYSVNGQFAASSPGNTYFDLGLGAGPTGSPGSTLGGYFQIQTTGDPLNPNSGTAIFSDITITPIPEPSSWVLLSAGILPLLLRRRRI